ncbi:MAG: hypothetical protein JSW62_05720, partial [Thermoplasmatales archaeon]
LPMTIDTEDYKYKRRTLPTINGSASIDSDNQLHVSISNISLNQNIDIEIQINDYDLKNCELTAKILQNEQLNAHNTFEAPETVIPIKFDMKNFNLEGNNLYFKIPSKAVLVIEIK